MRIRPSGSALGSGGAFTGRLMARRFPKEAMTMGGGITRFASTSQKLELVIMTNSGNGEGIFRISAGSASEKTPSLPSHGKTTRHTTSCLRGRHSNSISQVEVNGKIWTDMSAATDYRRILF